MKPRPGFCFPLSMLDYYILWVLATSFTLCHVNAAVERRATSSSSPALSLIWSHDATQCKTNTCISDCQAATAKLCTSSNLTTFHVETVGDCTAYYWYDAGNNIPSAAQCNAAFGQITGPPSKAGSSNDCPGFVGGASGYGRSQRRTNDPVYIVTPAAANGNCLKSPGDNSSVLATNEVPNGQSLSTCPVSSSRRKRELARRHGSTKCNLESDFVAGGCSATCVVSVTASAWECVVPNLLQGLPSLI